MLRTAHRSIAVAVGAVVVAWSASVAGAATAALPAVTQALHTTALSSSEVIQLRTIATDSFNDYDPQCVTYKDCSFGNPKSRTSVLLFGDSHIQMWLPALIPTFAHDNVTVLWKPSCPIAAVNPWDPFLKATDPSCPTWRASEIALIEKVHPALVVVAERTARALFGQGRSISDTAWAAGVAATLGPIEARGIKVVMLGDTPAFPTDPTQCLGRFVRSIQRCSLDRSTVPKEYRVLTSGEQRGAGRVGATFIDPTPWLCTATTCPATLRGTIAYFDWSHLTVSEVRALTPQVETALKPFLAR